MKKMAGAMIAVLCTLACSAARADEPAPDVPQALKDLAARLKLEKEIVEYQRAMLKSDAATGVTLPSGTIDKMDTPLVPSMARFVAYDALRDVAAEICGELKGRTLLVTTLNLRDMHDQRLAVLAQLGYLTDRAADAQAALKAQKVDLRETAGVASTLLALDAVNSIGKAIAGLAAFFKTERKIGMVADVVDDAAALLAVRTCAPANGIVLVDPAALWLTSAQISVTEVTDLRNAADGLRTAIRMRQAELDRKKLEMDDLKGKVEAAKDDEKKRLQAELAKAQTVYTSLDNANKGAAAVLTAADAALDKLYAIPEGATVSPIVALARISAIEAGIAALPRPAPPLPDGSPPPAPAPLAVLAVKVQHASGYTQVSKAWWRSDRLDFAGGVAVTYQLTTVAGGVLQANGYYMQTPWMRLEDERGAADTKLRQWRRVSAKP